MIDEVELGDTEMENEVATFLESFSLVSLDEMHVDCVKCQMTKIRKWAPSSQ